MELSLHAVFFFVLCALSLGDPLYASPNGNGTSCLQVNPCLLQTALENSNIGQGRDIALFPGVYTTGSERFIIKKPTKWFAFNNPGVFAGQPVFDGTFSTVGMLEVACGLLDMGTVTLDGLVFRNSTFNATAIIVDQDNSCNVTVVRSTFQWSFGKLFYSAVDRPGVQTIFSQCTIRNNVLFSQTSLLPGLLHVSGYATLTIESSLFQDNVDLTSSPTVGGCIVADLTESLALRVTGSRFLNNQRQFVGPSACIFIRPKDNAVPSSLEIHDTDFRGNSAHGHGAALFLHGVQTLLIRRSLFTFNTGNDMFAGGAVHVGGCQQSCLFDNCTFRSNTATTGGALSLNRADPWLMKVRTCCFLSCSLVLCFVLCTAGETCGLCLLQQQRNQQRRRHLQR